MGQRSILCTDQMMDIDMDQQGQGYRYHGPHIHIGGHMTSFQQPNIRTMVSSSGSSANYDAQYLTEQYDSSLFYSTQYNGVHHHHHQHQHQNLDLGVATPGHHYYLFMPPSSSTRVLPVPLNHGASDQLSSPGGYGVVGSPADEFGRSNHFIDGARGPCKRKVPESVHGNHHPFNASETPSSSVPPSNTRHPGGSSASNHASFTLPRHTGNGSPPIMDVGHQNAARSRLAAGPLDSAVIYDHRSHLARGNFVGQHFQPSGGVWLEQHLGSSSGDGGALAWNQAPNMSFMHGTFSCPSRQNPIAPSRQNPIPSHGSVETANIGMPRHHEMANIRSSQSLRHPPSVNHRNLTHHSSQPTQRPRGHNNLTATSHRSSSNSSRTSANLPRNALEMSQRHAGTAPPTGIRIYRPHRGAISDAALRQQHLYLRHLHADEVAILEIPDYYEVGEYTDNHSDMRLDIEDMSYEELLALGERIGNVNTGVSEETIDCQLKTVSYLSPGINMNLEQAECSDKEADCCIICQDNYKIFERIGILDCGHDYHAECLKKWLLIKNVCPICKSEALTTSMDL